MLPEAVAPFIENILTIVIAFVSAKGMKIAVFACGHVPDANTLGTKPIEFAPLANDSSERL
jgi:maleate cis-trans isomerase